MRLITQFLNRRPRSIAGYRLLEEIAVGGMSTIYKTISPRTKDIVAIKVLFPHYSKHKKRLQRLFMEKQVEGEMATGLRHPYVIQIYSYGRTRNQYYFIMEYIDGPNLKDVIFQKGEPIEKRKFDIIVQTAEGLKYIHSKGIIHRDICPKNILVSKKGEVKIIDFGLAVSKSSKYRGLGERSGTPSYMSPEQIRSLQTDERTDIYSFGVTMYEILSGKPPFAGEDAFTRMQEHLSFEPVPLSRRVSDIPSAFEKIVSRAMQKNPDDRYKSMGDLLNDLKEINRNESSL